MNGDLSDPETRKWLWVQQFSIPLNEIRSARSGGVSAVARACNASDRRVDSERTGGSGEEAELSADSAEAADEREEKKETGPAHVERRGSGAMGCGDEVADDGAWVTRPAGRAEGRMRQAVRPTGMDQGGPYVPSPRPSPGGRGGWPARHGRCGELNMTPTPSYLREIRP